MKRLERYIPRNRSVLTGKDNLEPLHTVTDFPVFFGCVDTPPDDDIVADMEWKIDPDTGVIQLAKLVPLEILYQSQHVDGCGPTWQRYYETFARYVAQAKLSSVLEIGGGQGRLAQLCVAQSPNLTWTILEPNPTAIETANVKILKGFLDENFSYDGKVDAVVFGQVMEHAYDPKEFLRAIARFLKPGGLLIFAYPNLKAWLEQKYTNALNFEHTMFVTDYFVDYLLAKTSFETLEKSFYEDHSIFYTARVASGPVPFILENKYAEYKKIFDDFTAYHETMVRELNTKIAAAAEPVYLFGAHIFSQFLIRSGLSTDRIVSVLDNSPAKQGKRLYGTSCITDTPRSLRGKGKVNVILKAGVHTAEIRRDILENINGEAVFW